MMIFSAAGAPPKNKQMKNQYWKSVKDRNATRHHHPETAIGGTRLQRLQWL